MGGGDTCYYLLGTPLIQLDYNLTGRTGKVNIDVSRTACLISGSKLPWRKFKSADHIVVTTPFGKTIPTALQCTVYVYKSINTHYRIYTMFICGTFSLSRSSTEVNP